MSLSLGVTKGISVLFIILSGALGCGAPIIAAQTGKRSVKVMHYLGFVQQCFVALGAGVVVATALVHIMPDGMDGLVKGQLEKQHIEDNSGNGSSDGDDDDDGYPYGYVFILAGLIATYLIETELHKYASQASSATMKAHIVEAGIAVHSVLVGVAYGTLGDKDAANTLAVALCFHQLCEGFAVGPIVYRGMKSLTHGVILVAIFALAVPLGIAIGVLIAAYGDPDSQASNLTQGIMSMVASGLLLYVGCVEFLAPLQHDDIERQAELVEQEHNEGKREEVHRRVISNLLAAEDSDKHIDPATAKQLREGMSGVPVVATGSGAEDNYHNFNHYGSNSNNNVAGENTRSSATRLRSESRNSFVQTWGADKENTPKLTAVTAPSANAVNRNTTELSNDEQTRLHADDIADADREIEEMKGDFLSQHKFLSRMVTHFFVILGAAIMSVIALWA